MVVATWLSGARVLLRKEHTSRSCHTNNRHPAHMAYSGSSLPSRFHLRAHWSIPLRPVNPHTLLCSASASHLFATRQHSQAADFAEHGSFTQTSTQNRLRVSTTFGSDGLHEILVRFSATLPSPATSDASSNACDAEAPADLHAHANAYSRRRIWTCSAHFASTDTTTFHIRTRQ